MRLKKLIFVPTLLALFITSCDFNSGGGSKHEHTYSEEWSSDDEYHWHDSTCGHDVISGKEQHSYVKIGETQPSFESEGFITYECSVCKHQKNEKNADKLDHNFSEEWEHDGTHHWHKCLDEGYSDVKGSYEEHDFEEEVVQPTYDAKGYTIHTCKVCEYSFKDNETEKLEHNFSGEWEHNETHHWHKCLDEGYPDVKGSYEEHDFEDEVVSPTFETKGYTLHTCKVCEYSYKDNETNKLDHNYSDKWSYDDYKHWHACTDENYEHLKTDEEPHKYVPNVTEPTFEGNGFTTYTCSTCGHSYVSDYVPALEHSYSKEWSYDENYHWHACTDTGYENLKKDYSSHFFIFVSTDEPGEYTSGANHYQCECGKTKIEVIPSIEEQTKDHLTLLLKADGEGDYYEVVSINNNDYSKTIVIPSQIDGIPVKSIGDDFRHNSSFTGYIKKIVLPNTLKHIGDSAFLGMKIDLSIPDSVVSLGSYALSQTSIKSFVGSAALTSIGKYCFYKCLDLESVVFNGDITVFPEGVFRECTNLKTIDYKQDSLISIERYAFMRCQSLKSISIGKNVNNIPNPYIYFIFSEMNSLESITVDEENEILSDGGKKNVLLYDRNEHTLVDEDYVLPTRYLFLGCKNSALDLSDDYAYVFSPDAFCNISENLETVSLPTTTTVIHGHSFNNCSSIKEVIIPKYANYIGGLAGGGTFYQCSGIDKITVDSLNKNYTSGSNLNAIYSKDCKTLIQGCLNTIVLDTTKTIGTASFSGCTRLKTISLPNGLESIESEAFWGCENLESITIPGSTRSIGSYRAFGDCVSLTNLVLENGVDNIGDSTFYGCTALVNLDIPDSVTYINARAFDYCSNLENVTMSKNLNSIDVTGIFANCDKIKYSEYKNGRYLCDSEGDYVYLHSIIDKNISSFEFHEDCLFIENSVFESKGPWSSNSSNDDVFEPSELTELRHITLPSKLKKICNSTFYYSSIEEITIPEGVTAIGENAFGRCGNLKTIYLPTTIASFSKAAFGDASVTEIENVYFGGSASQWNQISFGNNSSNPCKAAAKLYFGDTLVEEVTIDGEDIFNERGYHYYGCSSIKTVRINSNVTRINKSIFEGCVNIENIYYNGNSTDWETIDKGQNWCLGVLVTEIHCTDKDIPIV